MRTLTIGGEGIQEIRGLAATPDGGAWIEVTDATAGDRHPPPVMQISGITFPDGGLYRFKVVP